MTAERGSIAALLNDLTVPLGAHGARERLGKHSRSFLRPSEGALLSGEAYCADFVGQAEQRSGIGRRAFGLSPECAL